MIESKHTSGPWSYEGGDDASCEVNAGRTTISITRWDKNTGVHVIDRDEMEANGKLIAAAPELLEAIQHAFDEMLPEENPDLYAKINEAIKKATV